MTSQNICRLCLKSSLKNVNIFPSDVPLLIEALTCIKVEEDDGLPAVSCEECISDLRVACEVKKHIIESDNKLKNYTSHYPGQITEIFVKTCAEDFVEEKTEIENIDYTSQNTSADVFDENSDYDDTGDRSSDEGDDNIDNLIKSIEHDGLDDSSCDIQDEIVKTEPQLEKTDEIKEEGEDYDFLDNEDAEEEEEEEESVVSSTYTKRSKRSLMNGSNEDFIVLPGASDIIETDSSGRKRKYSCKLCHIELDQRKVFLHKYKHIKAKCKRCGLVTRIDNARKHLLTHKLDPQVCHICGSSHKSHLGLRSHLYYAHTNRVPYKCKNCDKEFRISTHLQEHIRKYHTGDRPYQCDLCGKAYITSYNLKKHKESVHQHVRPHQCEYCKKAFQSRYTLKIHRRLHTGELPYICDLCTEGFRQLVSLKTHKKFKHSIIMKVNKSGYLYADEEQAKN